MRSSWVVSCLVLALAWALPAGAAAAAEGQLPHGPMLGQVPPPQRAGLSVKPLESGGNPLYHGGPVVHRSTTYAIFWTGPARLVPASFESGMSQFLQAVADASGRHDNVYSASAEYGDTSAVAAYDSKFGGALQDISPLPSNGCTGPNGFPCVSTEQIRQEVDSFLAANQLPRGLRNFYLVFLPPGYDTCGGSSCAYTNFCGYHNWFGGGRDWTLYALLPWPEPGCVGPYAPNGYPALDTAVSVVSHEQIENYTDPIGNGWFDGQGQEVADKCAWVYGSPLGSTSFGFYNQQIGSGNYALQLEWSNATSGCVAHSDAAPPAPPGNDLLANAQRLTGRTAQRSGDSTFQADKEPGEPNHGGNEGGSSVWYSWTPAKLGTATVDTFGSNFDTLLGVYTGSAASRLTEVGGSNDFEFSTQSRVRFIARPGTTYRIAVDGFNEWGEPTGGNLQLHLAEQPPPNTRIAGSHRIATSRHRARVRFNLLSRPRAAGFECGLDGRAFRRCRRHPVFVTGGGPHVLRARAIAPSGLRDPKPARFSFVVSKR